jgi:hypothetical protein
MASRYSLICVATFSVAIFSTTSLAYTYSFLRKFGITSNAFNIRINRKASSQAKVFRIKPLDLKIASTATSDNFKSLRLLDERVQRISDLEYDYLSGFYNDRLKCFQIYPNSATDRVSIISTCLTLNAILNNPGIKIVLSIYCTFPYNIVNGIL